MKSTKSDATTSDDGRELHPDGAARVLTDEILKVNPRITFRWSSRTADADNGARGNKKVGGDESVGLSTLCVEERTLLALTDGRRSIDDLAKLAGMVPDVARRHLGLLAERGILISSDRGDMMAPRSITDALMTGPVEYDYSMLAGAEAPPAASTDGLPGGGASPTVIVAPESSAAAPTSPLSPDAVTLPTTAPSDGPAGQVSKRRGGSGPNVTLFWIPTPSEPLPSLESPARSGGHIQESAAVAISGPNTGGDATFVVVGSPTISPRAGEWQPVAPADAALIPPADLPAPVIIDASIPESAAGGGPSGQIPFKVGAYEVATRIAQGAMGSIYVCRRAGAVGLQRLFTLKVIRQHSTQKDIAVRSFTREARIGALVDHPNVQKLLDVGTYENQPFLILDYIEGTNLADLMADDRRIPAPIVVSVLMDVLRGLQHVHEVIDERGAASGLVHGDVSPQNVLIGVDGVARLTDFGSARFAMERDEEPDPVAVGKPAYMAPEQLRGELGDARTDLFSVGIVLWTALTGQKLFSAETYDQTAMRVMRRRIPPPSEHGAPASLDAIVLKALHRAPEGRYSTADEMARDLLKVASAENLVAPPGDVGQWVRRELGEKLVDGRRKIQEMFGVNAKTAVPNIQARPPRTYKTTPKTADGYQRLPAKTMQIDGAQVRRALQASSAAPAASSSSASWAAPAPLSHSERVRRRQWVLVILSAVFAGCALVVAIGYLIATLLTPTPQPRRAPAVAPASVSGEAPSSAASPGSPSFQAGTPAEAVPDTAARPIQ